MSKVLDLLSFIFGFLLLCVACSISKGIARLANEVE